MYIYIYIYIYTHTHTYIACLCVFVHVFVCVYVEHLCVVCVPVCLRACVRTPTLVCGWMRSDALKRFLSTTQALCSDLHSVCVHVHVYECDIWHSYFQGASDVVLDTLSTYVLG